MDDTVMRVVLLLIDIIGPISIGYFLKQKNLVKPAFNDFMIKLNVRGLFTVLAFVAFWKLKFTAEVALIPIAGLIILFVPYFLGMAITKKVEDPLERGALVVSSMLGNTSTLGGLLCFMLLGATSFAYVQVIGVLQSIVLILFCFPVCQKFHDMADTQRGLSKKRTFREMFFTWNQVSILGMLAGAALSLGGVKQPDCFAPFFAALVHISAWIAFPPGGLLLDFEAARREMPKTLWLMPLKFILMPLVVWALCAAVVTNPVMAATLIIVSSCPTAINSVLTCALYGLKTNIAVSSFMTSTTVFALVMCPIYFFLFR